MPWKSDKQRRWGHTAAGQKALGGAAKVAEWDQETTMQTRGTAPMLNDGAKKSVTSMLHSKPVGRPRKAPLEPGLGGKGMRHKPLQGGHALRRALAHAKARGGKE